MEKCEEALVEFNFVGGVSRRQIFDDIRFMESDSGWSIPLERLRDGKRVYYRYEDPTFTINEQPLTLEEARQLETAVMMLSRFRGLPSKEWIDEIISNLEYRFNLNGHNENLVGFEQNQNLVGLHYLTDIIKATTNHQPLCITYHNYKKGGREISFLIHPYYVKEYNNRWFLFGLEDGKKRIANLALDRIVSFEPAKNVAFVPNDSIDFEHYFDDVIGVTIPNDDVELQQIVLKFSKERFPYVKSKPIHPSQEMVSAKDGIVSIKVRPNRELEQQILSFGSDVEVVAPEDFRNKIAEINRRTMQIYSSCAVSLHK
jgi:predicted DNA-binding transcriptional regulator YafY